MVASSSPCLPPSPPCLRPSLPLPSHPLPFTHTLQLMALIGEHMSKSHLVNGAVVSRRKKGDRISLWTGKKSKKANLDIWYVHQSNYNTMYGYCTVANVDHFVSSLYYLPPLPSSPFPSCPSSHRLPHLSSPSLSPLFSLSSLSSLFSPSPPFLPSSPSSLFFPPHSKGFIKVLSLACQVGGNELRGFIQQLANNQNGLSLVYMHHTDSLKSGSSYQNDARISLREHIEVCMGWEVGVANLKP